MLLVVVDKYRDNPYRGIKRLFSRWLFQKVHGYERNMTWFIIFTTLLVVQSGISDILIGHLYNQVRLNVNTEDIGEVKKCEIETNIGDKYEFKPGLKIADVDYIYPYSNDCSIFLYLPNVEFAGEWKITSYFKGDNYVPVTKKFKIYINQEIKAIPNYIRIIDGYFIHAQLDLDVKNITNCTVITPTSQEIDLLNVHTKNLQRFGQCGFRALTNGSSYGDWQLKAIVEDRLIYVGKVGVDVFKNTEKFEETQTIITLHLGISGKVSLNMDRPITFCQLEDPMGFKTPFSDSCVYNIPVVTTRHQGVWTARYGGNENPIPTVQRFRVITRDPVSFGSNVIVTENKEIQLFCHTYDNNRKSLNFCHFIRPDGYVLNLNDGIGTEDYSSFNISTANHFEKNKNIYCGLIIHEPEQHDYGAWTCNIGLEYNEHRGSIIYVDPRIMNMNETQNASREFHIVAENVYVKRNDFFKIKCNVDAVLRYCWFRSPNGTFYSVIPNQRQSLTNLLYVGSGFDFGECAVKIDHASYTDHGEWTCNVGIVDGPEKSKTIFVNVTESHVIPERSELMANYEDNIILSCNILPHITDQAVRYCRWIRPDGHGIYNSLSHRYTTNHTNTQCKLMIASNYNEEDIGRWTCVVRLYGLEDEEEAWATITVHAPSATAGVLIGTITASLLLTAVLCALCFIHIRKKRLTLSKESEDNPTKNFVKA